jgi:uncharacterized membrane protein
LAGMVRLFSLATGVSLLPGSERFFAAPVPVTIHIIGSLLFLGGGAFQFVDALRRRYPRWHKMGGRVFVGAGLASALSGLWMNQFYALPAHDGVALYLMRLAFGAGMAALLLAGLVRAMQRRFPAHRGHMLRSYAIGMGAGTQVLTTIPLAMLGLADEPGPRAVAMGAGWIINLLVVELILRRHQRRPAPVGAMA